MQTDNCFVLLSCLQQSDICSGLQPCKFCTNQTEGSSEDFGRERVSTVGKLSHSLKQNAKTASCTHAIV